ncbi:hypothetical protein OIU84_015742 [Salix udensis]|uniref:Uncharacterized protein n=1 Tax=Salix udensis TaxID=889485 RepID=A0AAD6NNN8_9ROSI|nr:hypothetical protein OIU84_015742 [Salix udensis]
MFKSVREDEVRDAVGALYQQWINNNGNSQKLLVEMKGWFSDITLNVILKIVVNKRYVNYGGVEKKMKKTAKNIDHALEKWLEEHKQKKASGTTKGEEDFMDLMLSVLDDVKELSNRNLDSINKATCLENEKHLKMNNDGIE